MIRAWRRAGIEELAGRPLDALIIGGGITGAGIARDAARRGLAVGLVDQGDLAQGTSSRSSRLIHGGLRYLEHRQVRLVHEAVRERATLLRIAPHLVRPLDFLFPIHDGDRVPLWKLAAGIVVYDVLARFRNVRGHRLLGKRGVLAEEPMLREKGLQGGVIYRDAQCDDARLVVATARSAISAGALVGTYLRVTGLRLENGRATGAHLRDELTSTSGIVSARLLVNATGPWTDVVRRLEDPAARPMVRTTRGSHIVVPRHRIGHRHAITFLSPLDGRVMFILPWGELSYIGTTDTDDGEDPAAVRASEGDVHYLLRSANARFPGARLGPEDVRASWAGLRPLLAGDGAASDRSREHAIETGPAGMITIAGGKLTTYRAMAADVTDRVAAALGHRGPRADTAHEPLPGGEAASFEPFRAQGLALGLPEATVGHLVRNYGTETAGILNLGVADRGLLAPLHPGHPAIAAEAVHAVRRELAQRVEDVLLRRTRVAQQTADRGRSAARAVAALLGRELGWDEPQAAREAERYEATVGAATWGP